MAVAILPPVLPWLTAKLNLTLAMAGTLVSVIQLSTGMFQPLVGHWMDRKGRPWLLAPSLTWVGILLGLVGVVNHYGLLLVVVGLAGLGSAVYHPLGMVMVRNTLPQRGGTAMSIWSLGGTAGMALAPLVALAIVSVFGLAGMWLLAVPAIVLALAATLLKTYRLPVSLPAANIRRLGAATAAADRAGRKNLFLLSTALFFRSILQVSLNAFLPAFYTLRGFSPEYGALILALYLISGSVGSMTAGLLSDRIGRRTVTLASQVLGPVFIFGFLVTDGWLAATMLALGAANLYATFGAGVVYGQELIPSSPGAASGFIAGFAWGLGALFLGPIGAFGDNFGLPAALMVVAGLCLLATVFVVKLPETLRRGASTA